ncbi:MAG TPA: hypothetical protein VEM40_06925 [Nitrospirota bacterium]|nr:hypothetical protein [Nitrospirota bacterium]
MLTYNGDHKVATVAMMLAGPIIGLLYVVFLPVIGIATLAVVAGRKALTSAVSVAGKTIAFGWRPVEAYLAGRKKEKKRNEK